MREYIGGKYQYNTMKSPKWTCVRRENIDFLPPTMLHPLHVVMANNKVEALKKIKGNY